MIKVQVDIDENFLNNYYKEKNTTKERNLLPVNEMPNTFNPSELSSSSTSKIENDLSEITKAINGLNAVVKTLSENVVTKSNVEDVVSKVVTRELENKLITRDDVVELIDSKLKDLPISNDSSINLKNEFETLKSSLKKDLLSELLIEFKASNVDSSLSDINIESLKSELKSEIQSEFETDYKKKVTELENLHQKKLEELNQLHLNQMTQLQQNMMNQLQQVSMLNTMNQVNPLTQVNPLNPLNQSQFPTQNLENLNGVVEKIEEKENERTAPSKSVAKKMRSMMDI